MSLTGTRTLWALFILVVALSLVFAAVMAIWDFAIIDEMWKPAAVQTHIEAMTPTQRRAHAWLTGTVDVAYPFAYAALFAGLALRHLGRLGSWVAALSAAIIPADLVEGLAQVMILNGDLSWLGVKSIATPVKLGLYVPALLFAILAGSIGAARWLKNGR